MLNVPSQSFPAAGSQQRVAPTGQSRNKVALKPGHSLLDWIRLTKSGRDLTGLRGRLIEVTEEELKKHNTRNDCWTCIRGMVYNVSAYMDFHPGGEEELMRAAGIDSTDLFDQVHRWVNYESMLKECLVGRMAVKPNPALQGLSVPSPLRQEPLPAPLPAKDHRPRYDWFQTDGTVNIVVHTKRKIPSAGCAVVDLQDDTLRVDILLGKMSYLLYWRLSSEVQGSVDVQTAHSVGKVQVCLHKSVKEKWTKVGQPLEHHDTFIQCKDRGEHIIPKANSDLCGDVLLLCFYIKFCLVFISVDFAIFHTFRIGSKYRGGKNPPLKVFIFNQIYMTLTNQSFFFSVSLCRKTKLMFFNRQERGILWCSQLDELCSKEERFEVEYVLSEPADSWKGKRGRIDACMLQNFLERPEDSKCLVCVCGPTGFTELAVQLVKELDFSEEEIHIFQG
uniref:Cytochrome b5 reductase 4 n=1 Tax=Cyprinus carpio TaxID=7962 RepID=A0A8C2ECA0_CYPCA